MADKHVGMGPEGWLKMWDSGWSHNHPGQEGDTHEHSDVYLKRNLSHLTGGDTSKTILVSLCGDSRDMEWLCSQGHSVVGAELSETAVKKVFNRKNGESIPHEVVAEGDLKIYSATDGKNLKVYVGNFLADAICPDKLGTFDCIWDGHGIVSLPQAQHQSYAKKLATFLKPKGKILFSTVDYDITQLKEGPAPALVSFSQFQELYPECEVKLLEDNPLPPGALEGVEIWSNPVVLVTF